MSSYTWNWSWISSKENTKNASGSIPQSGGTLFSFRQATRGPANSADVNSAFTSVGTNIRRLWSNWITYTRPLFESLPAGDRDIRWSYQAGRGLPSKIDALTYGIQGATLFVFNDASATKADGRYWHSNDNRPKTIAEILEDLYGSIADIQSGSITSASSSVDLNPLWAAIGHHYQDSSLTSLSTSLDARTGVLETYISQLSNDLYGNDEGYTSYGFGTPLDYSVAKNIDKLLQIHNITGGWQSDPSSVSHSGVPAAAHEHPYDEITTTLVASDTQGRSGSTAYLENDIKRLRWEIQRTRGSSSWYSDATSPISGSPVATLQVHVNYVGSGTATTTNPHGINYVNTGASTMFGHVQSFTGQSSITDASPTYSSTNYVVQGSSLETAIGELDSAIVTVLGSAVIRRDYSYDRSSLSETEREQTPITINHNVGRKPIINVLDVSPQEVDYWGMYVDNTRDVEIVHLNDNSLEIWTGAAVIEVIAIF